VAEPSAGRAEEEEVMNDTSENAPRSSKDAAISSNDRLSADQQELVDVRGELLNALHAAGVRSSEVRDAIDSLIMTRLKHAGLGPLAEPAKATEDCPDCTKLIEERDRAEAYADQLADMISIFLEVDIGEHSSANCPWEEAIEAMRVAIGNKPNAAETGESAAELAFYRASMPESLRWDRVDSNVKEAWRQHTLKAGVVPDASI
jgi:hypothetical protein